MLNVVPRRIQQLLMNGMDSSLEEGIVLYTDISGFTSITESLLEQGKRGAETLSSILNRIFSRAVEHIYGYGGEVADFEGDAIIATFSSEKADRAQQAALALKSYFNRNSFWKSDIGRWPVSARISLASGSLEWHIVGTDRLAFFVDGTAVSRAVRLSAENSSEQVSYHESFTRLMESTGTLPENNASAPGGGRGGTGRERIRKSTALRFVSRAIVSSKLTGEFRSVIPVFVHLRKDRAATIRSQAEEVLKASTNYGGELSGFFSTSPGFVTGLVLFGAPISWENNSERAFEFSLGLLNLLGDSFRAGISSGRVYAGIIGNSRRCRYTVYGDTVNTAARLACKAGFGEILVTEDVSPGRERSYHLSAARRWLPRGKSDDILIHRLESADTTDMAGVFPGEMLGRSLELSELLQKLKPLESGRFAGITMVCGDPGMGKSRLLFEAIRHVPFSCQSFVLRCDDILRKSLNPFIGFLRNLFHQSDLKDREENRHTFEDTMRFIQSELKAARLPSGTSLPRKLERASSIIGAMLGHNWPDSVYSKLAAESRLENTFLSLKTLITSLSMVRPVILVIEDMQWMDSDSRRALGMLASNIDDTPLGILISSRLTEDGSVPSIPECKDTTRKILLRGIDDQAAIGVIADRLGAMPGQKLSNFILRNSLGNPFYIEQFCMYLMETGQIKLASDVYRLSGEDLEIPSGIRSILVARMDRLPHRVREFMQTASVLGQEFNIDTLQLVSGSSEELELINEGQRLRIWSRQSGSVFAFNHALYRDTAYGMLLGKSLSRLHARAADVLIELNRNDPEPVAGEIALHLMESRQLARAVDWGWKALCHAMDEYRNTEVLQWSDRLREWIMTRSSPGNRGQLLLDVLLKKDAVLHSMGRRRGQEENLEEIAGLTDQEGWSHRTAEILKARGTWAWSIGEIDEAYILFKKGLKFSRRASDEAVKGKLLGNMANIYASRGKYRNAQEYYDLALGIHRKLGDRKQEGITLGNLAILLRRMGEEKRAEKCYGEALAIHREAGNRIGEGRILCGLGNLENDPDSAQEYYLEALRINRETGDIRNEAITLSNLGRLKTLEGDYGEASRYLLQALQIHRVIGNTIGEADISSLFGELYYFQERWPEAGESFSRAIELSRNIGDSRGECVNTGLLGLVSFGEGAVDQARDCYGICHRLITEFGFSPSIDDSILMLRERLLNCGIDESLLPLPEHWQ